MYVRIVAQNELGRSFRRLYLPQLTLSLASVAFQSCREVKFVPAELELSPSVNQTLAVDCSRLSRSAENTGAEKSNTMGRRLITRITCLPPRIIVPFRSPERPFASKFLIWRTIRSSCVSGALETFPAAGWSNI